MRDGESNRIQRKLLQFATWPISVLVCPSLAKRVPYGTCLIPQYACAFCTINVNIRNIFDSKSKGRTFSADRDTVPVVLVRKSASLSILRAYGGGNFYEIRPQSMDLVDASTAIVCFYERHSSVPTRIQFWHCC